MSSRALSTTQTRKSFQRVQKELGSTPSEHKTPRTHALRVSSGGNDGTLVGETSARESFLISKATLRHGVKEHALVNKALQEIDISLGEAFDLIDSSI